MRLFARRPNRGDTERLGGRNERESCRALRLPDPSGGRGRYNRAAVHRRHRSRAIRGLLMAHLYKRAANHWKRPPRFEGRESEQEEESQPLQRTGASRSLKDIIKAKPRKRAPWK